MLKVMIWGLSALIAGLALGVASLALAPRFMPGTGTIQNGAWAVNPLAGSAGADPYSKLYIARTSVLALNKSETVYYEARTDDEGRALTSACDYLLNGAAPPARWWSVTAYGPDDMLIANPAARYSASAGSVAGDNAALEIALTPDGAGPNGIASGNAGAVTLLLRLYMPEEVYRAAPGKAPVFSIARGSCRS
jgi:hypothetical protein